MAVQLLSQPDYMSNGQWSMHQNVIDYTAERLKGWNVELLRKFFDLRTIAFPTYVGSFSWSCKPLMSRWLYEPNAINYGGGYVTPADIARDYLSVKYPNRKIRCTTSQWQNCVRDRRQPPIVCKSGHYGYSVYLDLSGAFWQIIRTVGWDVNYNPGRLLQSNSRMTDFPYPDNKLARNCLVSIGLPTPMRLWTGEKLTFVTRQSRFVNLIAWRLVQDVLNGVAYDMIKAGATYVYTDGYVLPKNCIDDGFAVLDSWGLSGEIKYDGDVHLAAPGCYQFSGGRYGAHETQNYKLRKRDRSMHKIYDPDNNWLRGRFKKYAEYTKLEWEWKR